MTKIKAGAELKFDGRTFQAMYVLNKFKVAKTKNPYSRFIPAGTERIFKIIWDKKSEDYLSLKWHAIPVTEIENGNIKILEEIDPYFKENNQWLYEQLASKECSSNNLVRTYDDSFSRQIVTDFFSRYFNVKLISHPRTCI